MKASVRRKNWAAGGEEEGGGYRVPPGPYVVFTWTAARGLLNALLPRWLAGRDDDACPTVIVHGARAAPHPSDSIEFPGDVERPPRLLVTAYTRTGSSGERYGEALLLGESPLFPGARRLCRVHFKIMPAL